MMPISSAVMAASTARKVMYCTTRNQANSGPWVCNQEARLSSIGCFLLLLLCVGGDRFDHPLHLHETRTLDQDALDAGQCGQHRGVQRRDVGEVLALHVHGHVAQREQLLDAALARVLADFGVEG